MILGLGVGCSDGSASASTGAGDPGNSGNDDPNGDATSPDSGMESGDPGQLNTFGGIHSGNMWLGPVDYAETAFHNACAPESGYPEQIRQLYGNYLFGLSDEVVLDSLKAGVGQRCDACAELKANGRTLIAHAVTYGQETGPNDIDLSPEARNALGIGDSNYTGTWQFITCPTTAPIRYTFDGRQWSNTWFFRVWVRNARVPVRKLEYRLGSGAWSPLEWQSDGAWEAAGRDFAQGFSLRVTSLDNQTIEDLIQGLGAFDANQGIESKANFK